MLFLMIEDLLDVHYFPPAQIGFYIGFHAAVDAWQSMGGLDAVIGAGCSVVCQPVSLLAAAWNIPIVSYSCSSSSLSNKRTYPTFT